MSNGQRTRTDQGSRRSRQIERDIARTRDEMDHTLDAIGDRLHPRHLIDGVLEMFRSEGGSSNEFAVEARRSGKQLIRKIKRNPVPALLIGAGAAWLLMEDETDPRRQDMRHQWDDIPEHSGSFVDARTGEPYENDGDGYGERPEISAAWHDDYDWSDAYDGEEHWTPRAEATLDEIRQAVSQSDRPLKEQISLIASRMVSVSGRRRSEIQRALRAQWDDIPEHSGSFVDARTGQPYDDSYGQAWRQLAALDVLSSEHDWDESEDEGWRQRAQQALKSVQESASDSSTSAKQRLNAIGSQLSSLVEGSRGYTAKYGRASGRRAKAMARSTGRGIRHAGSQIGSGYETTRDYVAETAEEHPVAMGLGVLGIGLLIGSMLPSTRREDRAFGERSDAAKERAADAGREAMRRGQEAASTAGEAAYEEAERQGLTPSQIAQRTREGAEKVASSAREETASADDLRSRVGSVVEQGKEAAKEELQGQRQETAERSTTR